MVRRGRDLLMLWHVPVPGQVLVVRGRRLSGLLVMRVVALHLMALHLMVRLCLRVGVCRVLPLLFRVVPAAQQPLQIGQRIIGQGKELRCRVISARAGGGSAIQSKWVWAGPCSAIGGQPFSAQSLVVSVARIDGRRRTRTPGGGAGREDAPVFDLFPRAEV
jgi:hypothetical protein